MVLRADYKGGLVVESVVGSQWEPGGWILPVLIWKGHMVALQPPEGFNVEEFVLQEEYAATPALGFTFFWHSRHDQVKSAPGRIHCRLCKADRRAGEIFAPCRRHSCLAAVATMGAGKTGPVVMRELCMAGSDGVQTQLVLQEVFAGTGRITEAWKRSGVAKQPIEVFEEPHRRRGYRAEHDLLKKEVQQKVKQSCKQRDANVWWIAAPCTSYCDWQLQNGGSRTFEVPEGTGCGPLAEREKEGNELSTFAAELFLEALEDQQFPICESSASSGRYPKQWDLPVWKAILQREDVDYIDFPMCAWGLGPPDEPGCFYVHKTRLVFPRHGPLRQLLLRQCPGLGPLHKHVALKGAREGLDVTRCTEAGAYAWDFVTAVVSVLQSTLGVMGGGWFQTQLSGHAGGKRGRSEENEEQPKSQETVVASPKYHTEEELAEAAKEAGVDNQESIDEMWSFLVEDEKQPKHRRGNEEESDESQTNAGEEEYTGRWCSAEGLEQQNLIDEILDQKGETEAAGGQESPVEAEAITGGALATEEEEDEGQPEVEDEYEPSLAESGEGEKIGALEATEEETEEEAMPSGTHGDDPPWEEPVVADFWEAPNLKDGTVRRAHPVSRRHLFVPPAVGPPWIGQVSEERRTILINHRGVRVRVDDNWKEAGEVDIGYGLWTGFTIFPLKEVHIDWERWRNYGWGDDGSYEDDEEEPEEEREDEGDGQEARRSGASGEEPQRAGGSSPSSTYKAPNAEARMAAEEYTKAVDSFDNTAVGWATLVEKGNRLVRDAGSVQGAAESLWQVREEKGLMNLAGIDQVEFDSVLHPDHLYYLRQVRKFGMPARYVGDRHRVRAKLHPNAKRNVDQVFQQVAKDVKKHRVLVADSMLPELGSTVSSPFEAVDKMLPDRTISRDKRVVHDQRTVNCGTSKFWHPPALQPLHSQVARRILWAKHRCPGLPVLMAKKDISGAFRLLWVDPADVELFAGDLPWQPHKAFPGQEDGPENPVEGDITVVYLVSSFGFSGSPGEWCMWGRATEEYHRAHRPTTSRRDMSDGFDAKVLVDDCILVEPWVGLRPWVSAEVFEDGVVKMLGTQAVNKEKDEVEGVFRTTQTVWGIILETDTEKATLPERRIQKGAVLMSGDAFDYGSKTITLKEMQ